jgi:hypothetical protein
MIQNNLEPVQPYKSAKKRWKCVCKICGKTVYPTYNKIQQGRGGCRSCGIKIRVEKSRTPETFAVKQMLEAKLRPIEAYRSANKIWKWGNIITDIPRDIINYIEKIRMKGYTLETMKNNNQTTMFFYQFLNNDHMFIPDEKYLGLIIDLLLYLGEDLYIFTVPNNENELQLIGLKNINEIYV